jgi:Ca2+-transporting ATPase
VPLSIAVRGRARLAVAAVRRSPRRAARLEDGLAALAAVRAVHVNPLTGSVLILFDSARLPVTRLIAEVARHANGRTTRPAPPPLRDVAWHTRPADTVAAALEVDPRTGLSEAEAARRLVLHGANRLPAPRPKSALSIVTGHLASVPVLVLGVAAALSLASGALLEAAVIGAVVALNTVIGYATESRVERILTSLQEVVLPQAIVRREGGEGIVATAALVPGDVILLRPGNAIPADARLVDVDGLVVDESALTGESAPVAKTPVAVREARTPVSERRCMVYAGTVAAQGAATAIVTATGWRSELGRVRALVAETGTPPTPLERDLAQSGRRLVAVSLAFCAATLALGLLRGVPTLEMLRAVVSLGVAAVPEGLPAVATTTLALGVQRLMRRRTLVRRMAAVESLGGITVICADKTGTLTENRMWVHGWHLGDRDVPRMPLGPGGNGHRRLDPLLEPALLIGVLCNEAELDGGVIALGSATEGALLLAASDAGLDYRRLRAGHPVIGMLPRREGENWMATVHQGPDGRRLIAVKGAPEEILERASHWHGHDGPMPLTEAARSQIAAANHALAALGMRVLGLAEKRVPNDHPADYEDLVWLGLVALVDPVRAGVREAIAACRRAGIRTVILTGDQAETAAAVGRELGILADGSVRVLDASRLAALGGEELHRAVRQTDVFARVSPSDKYQIVRALQAAGEVVAMTGDGINDAAALKAADVGVAMGERGTAVARDVADVVLLDDDVGGIVQAIAQGRTIHDNVSRSLRFLLATNFSEVLVTLGTLGLAAARPLSPIQFLWINLLSDVLPALALAVEPPAPGVLSRPPRDPRVSVLSGGALGAVAADGVTLAAATLGLQAIAQRRHGAGAGASTVTFSTLTAGQLLYALGVGRGDGSSGGSIRRNPLLAGVVAGSLGLQALTVTAGPLRRLLGTVPLATADWALVAAGAALPLFTRLAMPITKTSPARLRAAG